MEIDVREFWWLGKDVFCTHPQEKHRRVSSSWEGIISSAQHPLDQDQNYWFCHPFPLEEQWVTGWSAAKAAKMTRGLEHLSCEERDLSVPQHIWGGCWEVETRLLMWRIRHSRLRLKRESFRLDIREILPAMRTIKQSNRSSWVG